MWKITLAVLCLSFAVPLRGDSGYELWLNYKSVEDPVTKEDYSRPISAIYLPQNGCESSMRSELSIFCRAALGTGPGYCGPDESRLLFLIDGNMEGEAGSYRVFTDDHGRLVVTAADGPGLLYGMYRIIREMQLGRTLADVDIRESPAFRLRMLNHWDELNGRVGRGYAGRSLWKRDELPGIIDRRYHDYARANASLGINAVVLNEVNADPRILGADYLEKVAALADVFRPYNIKVFLAANFAAPMKPSSTPDVIKEWGGIGHLDTADPMDAEVVQWWADKADEIYALIPDFGGYLVKANSEGMPGPQDYGRTHADGANLLARSVKGHGGIVLWRTFVYDPSVDPDRCKRSYMEFMPLDGQFEDNVVLQTKNGPLDFQPREPVQPLFGAMRLTTVIPKLQITQEYLGHSTYLVSLLPMWKEFFDFNTYCDGTPAPVKDVVTGKIIPAEITAIAGVANTGDMENWTGHHFAQANWYAYGRLAWNPYQDGDAIIEDWIRTTWNTEEEGSRVIKAIMEDTWESFAASNTPYAIGLTTELPHHYLADFPFRANNYWFIDATGVGTDRSSAGSDYVSQYFEPNRSTFDDMATCPEELLLHFHFVPWNRMMASGLELRDDLVRNLSRGVEKAERNIELWESLRNSIDGRRHREVMERLEKELADARIFYNSATGFFSTYIGHSGV